MLTQHIYYAVKGMDLGRHRIATTDLALCGDPNAVG